MTHPTFDVARAAIISPSSSGSNLPTPLTRLIGRACEAAAVAGLLLRPDVRLVTLIGPGGVGKTRLAIQVAAQAASAFPDGVRFVPLDAVREPGHVVLAIAQALDLRVMGGRPLHSRLTEYLQARSMMLVLDNFEHVMAAAPDVADLLTACPHLMILITSRDVLRLSGEHAFPVLPLALPDPNTLPSVAELMACEAIRLFLARAGGSARLRLDRRKRRDRGGSMHTPRRAAAGH